MSNSKNEALAAIQFPRRGDKKELEENNDLCPKFGPDGLIPCIVQDVDTGDVVMFAFMNDVALSETIRTGVAHYFSRSRGKLWKKGEQSGNTQAVEELRIDCDQDCVLIKVRVAGGASCHVGYHSCFYRKLSKVGEGEELTLELTESGKVFDPAEKYGK